MATVHGKKRTHAWIPHACITRRRALPPRPSFLVGGEAECYAAWEPLRSKAQAFLANTQQHYGVCVSYKRGTQPPCSPCLLALLSRTSRSNPP
jgi:hypothetical protein